MLYNEDYRVLNLEDENQLKKAEALITKFDNVNMISSMDLLKYHEMHPRTAYFNKSIFPNNYLYTGDLEDKDLLKTLHSGFFNLLSESGVTERDVLKYIKDNKAYCIIGSICQNFDFGHHDMYLFKEFRLSTNYISDYLVVGKNSHGYHFIFVEVEKPNGEITTKNGEFGTTIRRGIKQIDDWEEWIEANFHSLRLEFEKFIKPGDSLSKEFTVLDKTRINFVVIAGRRTDFTEKTYTQKRKLYRNKNIKLLHYDNLLDSFEKVIRISNY